LNIQSIIETIQNSIIDITNEIAKVKPRHAQSVSNTRAEYLEAIKKVIQSLTSFKVRLSNIVGLTLSSQYISRKFYQNLRYLESNYFQFY
jgi:cob(I)alamin adenosyltransferase